MLGDDHAPGAAQVLRLVLGVGEHLQEIENDYVDAIMRRYGVRTKTEAVDLALRHLAGDPMSPQEALAMRGARANADLPEDTSPADTA